MGWLHNDGEKEFKVKKNDYFLKYFPVNFASQKIKDYFFFKC